MKKILVYGMKNVYGGIENYLLNMQKYLIDDVRFIYVCEETQDHLIHEKRITEYGGTVIYLPNRHDFSNYKKCLREKLNEYRHESSVFYANISQLSFDFIPIRIALKEGYQVITHAHGAGREPISSLSRRVIHSVLRFWGRKKLYFSKIERLAVSDRSGKYLYKDRQFTIVSPGIEVTKFAFNDEVRKKKRQEIGVVNKLVLGFVGRLAPVKNPLFLLEVVSELIDRGVDCKLLILGDGELKNEMEKLAMSLSISDDIIFMGAVTNVEDYLQAMDVLLAPSFSEGMPLGIMEAQSAGLPCICAKGNFPESIDVTGEVVFCDLRDGAVKWADIIQNSLNNQNDRIRANDLVQKSNFNIVNASRRLLQSLTRGL